MSSPLDDTFAALSKSLQGPLEPFSEPLASGSERARRSALNRLLTQLDILGSRLHGGKTGTIDQWEAWHATYTAALNLRAALWARRASLDAGFIDARLSAAIAALDQDAPE